MTEQIRRQRRETERMEIVIAHMEMVGNRRECHGKAGERWRRSEKIRYMTSAKRQEIISLSTMESEYVAAVHAAKEALWLPWQS